VRFWPTPQPSAYLTRPIITFFFYMARERREPERRKEEGGRTPHGGAGARARARATGKMRPSSPSADPIWAEQGANGPKSNPYLFPYSFTPPSFAAAAAPAVASVHSRRVALDAVCRWRRAPNSRYARPFFSLAAAK
jgi:hypothetical protein